MKRILSLLLACLLLGLTAAGAANFPDVPAGSWCEQAIDEMADCLSGYPDGTFRPNGTITAAEFVTLCVRCAGLPAGGAGGGHWAGGAMRTALEAGWYDWDELPPTGERYDKPIERHLAVKILMRAFLPEQRGDYNRESAKIADFSELDGRYYEPVLAAYAAGVLSGYPDGTFRPHGTLSRAEACVLIRRAQTLAGGGEVAPPAPSPRPLRRGGVQENGRLHVEGTQLCNERGETVVLRGMSSHGLQWPTVYTTPTAIGNTADCGANLFRVAMYTDEDGYLSHPEEIGRAAAQAVDAAIANDMYVILDWHILHDGNPMTNVEQAEAFFADMAARYADSPAVLYEICNEPNGDVSWKGDIRPYAERVIAAIRRSAPEAVVLVGSSTWSQDLHLVAEAPLEEENVMYTLHFYAGTHGEELRRRIDDALAAGLPVFVSEWGTSRADGNGGVYLEQAAVWLDFLAERGISWANWSLSDKAESSAALLPGTPPNAVWTEEDLSESGKFVFSHFTD